MRTVADTLPNLEKGWHQTESLLGKIPDDALVFRPDDPSGAFQFSVAEIFAHIADARTMFARVYLDGEAFDSEPKSGLYLLKPPGDDGRWEALGGLGRPLLESHLLQGRDALAPALGLPAERLLGPTKGGEAIHAAAVARQDGEAGPNDDLILSWGPASLARVLLTCASHEAGHRGAVVSLVRGLGVSVTD